MGNLDRIRIGLRTQIIFGGLFVLWSAILIPELNSFVTSLLKLDFLKSVGSGTAIGPGKVHFYKILATVIWVSTAGIFLFITPRKIHQIFLSLFLLLALGVQEEFTLKTVDRLRWDRFLAIRVSNLPLVDYQSIFARKLPAGAKTDLASLHRYLEKRFAKDRMPLNSRWKLESEDLLRATYYLNFVSAQWGSYEGSLDQSTCLRLEDPVNQGQDLSQMLTSKSACCTDQTVLLSSILNRSGISTRFVRNPGHTWIEAKIQNQWYTMDSVLNMMINKPYDEIDFANPTTKVTVFPNLNSIEVDNPNFNPGLAGARTATLLFFLDKSTLPVSYSSIQPYFIK